MKYQRGRDKSNSTNKKVRRWRDEIGVVDVRRAKRRLWTKKNKHENYRNLVSFFWLTWVRREECQGMWRSKSKVSKRCFIAEIFELKEDEEEEKLSLEFEKMLKILSFDNKDVSIAVTKFWFLLEQLEAKISFKSVKFIGENLNLVEEEGKEGEEKIKM